MMAVVFSLDLSWLSPLLIFVGVVIFISRQNSGVGAVGRVLIGLGLITLALQLIIAATRPLTESPAVRALLVALPNEILLDIVVGAVLTVLSYSSLAIVLLVATLATSALIPISVALGLVLGANIGSGILAMLATANATPQVRRPAARQPHLQEPGRAALHRLHAAGARAHGSARARRAPAGGPVPPGLQHRPGDPLHRLHRPGRPQRRPLAARHRARRGGHDAAAPPRSARPHHAVAGDLLRAPRGAAPGRRRRDHAARHRAGDPQQRPAPLGELRKLDDTVDELYSAIKFYLTQISGEALSKEESRRWTDIVSFTINMEQIGDIIERVLQDLEDKKVRKNRSFSEAGMAEIVHLHERLLRTCASP
jgi:phosphate:Na+ symporter